MKRAYRFALLISLSSGLGCSVDHLVEESCAGGCAQGGTGACGDGDGSGCAEGGGGPAGNGVTECVNTPSEIPLDEVTSLGFSPGEVLATGAATHDLSLVWRTGQLYAKHDRAGTTTALHLSFNQAAAKARFIDSQGGGCPTDGLGPCITCTPWVEIDLELALSTDDGSLQESAPVTLSAQSAALPEFVIWIPAADLKGSYFDGITVLDAGEPIGIRLEAHFDAPFSGSVATVPKRYNGFVAAVIGERGAALDSGVLQAHGYFPAETAGSKP